MKNLASILAPIRHLDLERIRGLRPHFPAVAVELEPEQMTLVRLKRARGKLTLEAHETVPLPEASVGTSIFRPNIGSPEEFVPRIKKLLEATGTKPGKISLIMPDNLAKVSLVTLPELPPSKKQLAEVIRFKLRRAVPFRLEDAVISYQPLPSSGGEVTILVALMLRAVVEQYEGMFEAAGTRPGLVDLCTSNVLNMCRTEMGRSSSNGSKDVALLNRTKHYFSLVILRKNRLMFYRCKSYGADQLEPEVALGVMTRELNTSLSYYQDKLDGQGIETIYVRSVGTPIEETVDYLGRFEFGRAIPIDPGWALNLADGARIDAATGQTIAPGVGASAGRN
jgi:type IV pilus assembly protein PilM